MNKSRVTNGPSGRGSNRRNNNDRVIRFRLEFVHLLKNAYRPVIEITIEQKILPDFLGTIGLVAEIWFPKGSGIIERKYVERSKDNLPSFTDALIAEFIYRSETPRRSTASETKFGRINLLDLQSLCSQQG